MAGGFHFRKTVGCLALFFALLALPSALHAQRTVNGTWFVGADGVCTFRSLGGQITFGTYKYSSYFMGGVNVAFRAISQNAGTISYMLPYGQYTATGDFMYRFCSSRTRWFTLNGGFGALLGVESYDPMNQRPEGVVLSETGGKFIFGFDLRVETEFFAFERVAFVLGARMPITFGSLCSIFNYEASLGLRFNL